MLAGCGGGGGDASPERTGDPSEIVLATTTELRDSGLLDTLLPAFQDSGDCSVTARVGTAGRALSLGRSGAADVLLANSPAGERRFVAAGHGSVRVSVLHDGFVLVGPTGDPAGAASAGDVVDALRDIAGAEATFLSRGDGSGTAVRERSLWKRAAADEFGVW